MALVLCLATPAAACETALLLAIDISGSIDSGEYDQQVLGLAAALADPDITDALVQGRSALAVVQWSGVGQQALVIPWQRMLTAEAVSRFAAATRILPRAFAASDTAVGGAIAFAAARFPAVADCKRRVIDISGDGPENAGFVIDMAGKAAGAGVTVSRARRMAAIAGIEINAIAIEDMGPAAPITAFYRQWAITKGGFVMTARGLDDYPRAIREKLLRELAKPAA